MKESNVLLGLKSENRNRIFRYILENGPVTGSDTCYSLHLSRPTVVQNINELCQEGIVHEFGSVGHTGGRRAKTYAVSSMYRTAFGLDITRNHVTVVMIDFLGQIIYEKRFRAAFSAEEEYWRKLGELISDVVEKKQVKKEQVLGVGIVLPALVTEDHQRVFYGKILGNTGLSISQLTKSIPYPCRMYNDADAAGYAEIAERKDLTNAFYISLSNNVGGAILVNNRLYRGEGSINGEVGHMTVVPEGKECYCGKRGCLETYCNARVLSSHCGGDLEQFFERLENGDEEFRKEWESYLYYLSTAVNNVRMLLGFKVILGGYVGAYMERYMEPLKELLKERNPFEDNADYVVPCQVKHAALALGGAIPFLQETWEQI